MTLSLRIALALLMTLTGSLLSVSALAGSRSAWIRPDIAPNKPDPSRTTERTELRRVGTGFIEAPCFEGTCSSSPRGASHRLRPDPYATRGVAQAGAQAAKVPTTAFGKAVEALKAGDKAWSRVTAHAEGATGRAYKGATSIEEVFEHAQTGERMVRHTIVRGEEVLHETYRTYAKFGAQ